MNFTNIFKNKNFGGYALIATVAIFVIVNLIRGCGDKNGEIINEGTFCDTVYQELVVLDTQWRDAPIPEPELKIVPKYIEVETNDTIFIDRVVEVPVEKIIYIAGQDSLYVYDTVYVHEDYNLYWHVEALGRVRNFAHRLEFVQKQATINKTTNLVQKQEDDRKWLLLAEGSLLTRFNPRYQTEYYVGGSLLRTERVISYGLGYQNQLNGDGHLFNAKLGIKF